MRVARLAFLIGTLLISMYAVDAQPARSGDAEVLERLEQGLRDLHAKITSEARSTLGLTGRRAVLFNEYRAQNANYVRTAIAAIRMTRQAPTFLNSYHAAVALTGLQYDLQGLLLAGRTAGTKEADRWSGDMQPLVKNVNNLGDIACARIEGLFLKADRRLRQRGR